MTIKVKGLEGKTSEHEVKSSMKIKDFIRGKLTELTQLPYFYLALIYLGKIAHPNKSFKEELV